MALQLGINHSHVAVPWAVDLRASLCFHEAGELRMMSHLHYTMELRAID
jgi:hypothetical protein